MDLNDSFEVVLIYDVSVVKSRELVIYYAYKRM